MAKYVGLVKVKCFFSKPKDSKPMIFKTCEEVAKEGRIIRL